MFFFSYALVPLYDVFCQLTGLNGKIEKANYKSPKTFNPSNYKNLKMEVVIRNNLPDIEFHTLGYTKIIDTNKSLSHFHKSNIFRLLQSIRESLQLLFQTFNCMRYIL